MKLTSPDLRHKSELGAFELNVDSPDAARAAYARLRALDAVAGARVLVERMAAPGVELLVAARADAVVPALVVGLGGVWTEALDDVAVIPLPGEPGARRAGAARPARRAAADRPPRPPGARRRRRRAARRRRPATCCSTPGSSCSS